MTGMIIIAQLFAYTHASGHVAFELTRGLWQEKLTITKKFHNLTEIKV